MSDQLLLQTSVSGSTQPRLSDFLAKKNDVFGVSGDAWNDSNPLGPFDNNLAGLDTVRGIVQWLDDADLGGVDTNFMTGNLERPSGAGPLTHQLNENSLTISSTGAFGHTGSVMQWNASAVLYYTAGTFMSYNTPYVEFRGGAVTSAPPELRLYEAADNGTDAVRLVSPPLQASYIFQLPDLGPTGAKVLASSSASSSLSAQLEWVDVPDTHFASDSKTRATNAGPLTHEFNNNDLTIQGSSELLLSFGTSVTRATSSVTLESPVVNIKADTATGRPEVRLFEKEQNGTNYFGLRPAESMTQSVTYTLPTSTPSSNDQVLGVLAGAGTASVSLDWVDAAGTSTVERAVIKFNTAYTAGTQINLDGTSANQTIIAGSDIILLNNITSQATLFQDKKVSFWVDGIRCDVTGDASAHCTAQYLTTTAVALTQDFPAGTLLEIERLS
jgi:hypothetical protein